ncbi:hypothetical protein PUN4_260035 [Paraburkholderia unamae]|nr:hypothetical protein PUN4_260035 [Paraburkholderia unamae]
MTGARAAFSRRAPLPAHRHRFHKAIPHQQVQLLFASGS